MPLDLNKIAPKSKERYLRIGRRIGSGDTLKQASKTLHALDNYGANLAEHGFGEPDKAQLKDAQNALITAGVGRTEQAGAKKTTSKAYLDAFEQAKTARLKAQTVLHNVLRALEDEGDEEAARKAEVALNQARTLPDDPESLAQQLDTLGAVFLVEKVAETAKHRGGATVAPRSAEAATLLRAAAEDKEGVGTQLSTEQMDIIDGLIVTLCRSAKRAAKSYAREQKSEAIVKAFALTYISAGRGKAGEAGDAEEVEDDAGKENGPGL